jgi:hypothetical protein
MDRLRELSPYILAALTALGAVGTGAGVINTNDQADLRLVAIRGMSEALARQVEECHEAVADATRAGFEMGKQHGAQPQ